MTNEEKREVARNIRENYARGGIAYVTVSAASVARAIGIPAVPIPSQLEFWGRLADLIEPEPEHTSSYDLLGERERRVLDMWPRWEDTGELVMPEECDGIEVYAHTVTVHIGDDHEHIDPGDTLRRPEVLAADGKPLHEGEHVWDEHGDELVVVGLSGGLVRCRYSGEPSIDSVDNDTWEPLKLTHEPPDTWERIEEDMGNDMARQQCGPISPELAAARAAEFVRRAKALCERGAE